jgi:hypothetical protein
MHLECGGVPVHFVHANFRIVVSRQQDFELQGARPGTKPSAAAVPG